MSSKISTILADILISLESLLYDVHVDFDACHLFSMPLAHLYIDNFQNDKHCKKWTRFKKSKLLDLVGWLGLEMQIPIHNSGGNFSIFTTKKY